MSSSFRGEKQSAQTERSCKERDVIFGGMSDVHKLISYTTGWVCNFESVDYGGDAFDLNEPCHCEQIVGIWTAPQFFG